MIRPVARTKPGAQRPSPDSRRPTTVAIARRAMPPNIRAMEARIVAVTLSGFAPGWLLVQIETQLA